MTIKNETDAMAATVERGLKLVFKKGMRPAEAAVAVVRSLGQFDEALVLSLVRRSVADLIEEALQDQRRVPRFDMQAERRSSRVSVREEDVQELAEIIAPRAKAKLDAYYASQAGEMIPLRNFSVSDHIWRMQYSAAQTRTWSQWEVFHRISSETLARLGRNEIADLPRSEQEMLEDLIP